MKVFLLTLSLTSIVSANLWANEVTTWKGSGQVYSREGKLVETYQISVVNTETSKGVTQSEATSTLSDGSQKTVSQTLTTQESGWSDDSNLGKGGGACYGADLCENYIVGSDGRTYATTIIQDSSSVRRSITFVLENGKAVKVLKDTVTKVK